MSASFLESIGMMVQLWRRNNYERLPGTGEVQSELEEGKEKAMVLRERQARNKEAWISLLRNFSRPRRPKALPETPLHQVGW